MYYTLYLLCILVPYILTNTSKCNSRRLSSLYILVLSTLNNFMHSATLYCRIRRNNPLSYGITIVILFARALDQRKFQNNLIALHLTYMHSFITNIGRISTYTCTCMQSIHKLYLSVIPSASKSCCGGGMRAKQWSGAPFISRELTLEITAFCTTITLTCWENHPLQCTKSIV